MNNEQIVQALAAFQEADLEHIAALTALLVIGEHVGITHPAQDIVIPLGMSDSMATSLWELVDIVEDLPEFDEDFLEEMNLGCASAFRALCADMPTIH